MLQDTRGILEAKGREEKHAVSPKAYKEDVLVSDTDAATFLIGNLAPEIKNGSMLIELARRLLEILFGRWRNRSIRG
jgi:hypothetical protein